MPSSKRAVETLLGALYDAAGNPQLWEPFLEQLAETVGAHSAALVMHQVGRELFTISSSWQVDPEASRMYAEHFGPIDVWANRGHSKPTGYVCPSQALCSRAEIRESEIYNDFMIRFGMEHGMFGLIENSSARWASLSLFRDDSLPEFRACDMKVLEFLVPHIQRAYKMHFQFSELKSRAQGVETALNMLSTGVIFVGGNGVPVLVNHKAEELLRRKDGLLLVNGKFGAAITSESVRVQGMILRAAQTGSGKGVNAGGTILVSRRTKRPLSITIAPLCSNHLGLGQHARAVIFISDPDQTVGLPADLLRRCYGLTQAEARLSVILLEGRSLKEAAELCGVTHNTARSQLKSIFQKTHVQRQSQLVRLLLSTSGFSETTDG